MFAKAPLSALLLALLFGAVRGQAWIPLDDDSSTVSLLQTKVGVMDRASKTAGQKQQGPELPAECGDTTVPHFLTYTNNNRIFHTHKADFFRPIPEVMREHPGVDGFCYFNNAAFYILYTPEPRDFAQEALAGAQWLGSFGCNPNAEIVTYHWQGEVLTTRPQCSHYIYDDLYGYFLGALQGQGMDTALLSNSTAWEEVSATKCEELQREYNITDEDLILNDLLDNNMPIFQGSMCAAGQLPGDCHKVTKREYALHHYMKCALGFANSGSDIAYLHARACLLEGNYIGHGSECPFDVWAVQ